MASLFRQRWRHIYPVFSLVFVDDDITLIIVAHLQQPGEHAQGIIRITDTAARGATVHARDILASDGPPVSLAGRIVGPALNPRKNGFDPSGDTD